MYRVMVCRSKFAWRPKRSPIGDHNSYRRPMFRVSLREIFQSSCAYPAQATFWEEMKFVVEMEALSTCPSRAEAIASPVLAATVGPNEEALDDGNAVSLLL